MIQFASLRVGELNSFFGRHHSAESKLKVSKAKTGTHVHTEEHKQALSVLMTGEGNRFFGKQHTQETRRKISEFRMGRQDSADTKIKKSIAARLMWQDPAFRQQILMAQRQGRKIKINRVERRILNIIEREKLPYRFSGDGSFVLGGYNPDFVQVNGKKKVIEVFGDYWHTNKKVEWHRTELGRINVCMQFGFDCLILWQSEIKKLSDWELTEKILQFDKRKVKIGGGRW